jgi:transcriptional regulator with XRE-family HTH domain
VISSDWIEDQAELANALLKLSCSRKEQGISQRAVGEALNTTQGVVSAIELMKHNLRTQTFMSYARVMGKRIRFVIEDINEQE